MLEYLKKYPEFILMAMGASFLAGAIFNWSLITGTDSSRKNPIIRLTMHFFGLNGYRILMGIIGIILLTISVFGLLKK